MKIPELPKGMVYIGSEILLLRDPVSQTRRTKEVHIISRFKSGEIYSINPNNGTVIRYGKFNRK